MPDATFTRPDLTTFTRLDGPGLEVTGQLRKLGRTLSKRAEDVLSHEWR